MDLPERTTNLMSRRQGRHSNHGICDRLHLRENARRFSRGRRLVTNCRRPYFDLHRWRGSVDLGSDLDCLETKDPCEIILTLGGNTELFKNYLSGSRKKERINRKLLAVLAKGFKSETTPALLKNVINTMVETEFVLRNIETLETHFQRRVDDMDDKDDLIKLHAVFAVLRILIRMYTLNPSAVTFVQGSFDRMSNLMKTIRNSLEVEEPNPPYRSKRTENKRPSEGEDVTKLDTDRVQSVTKTIKANGKRCEQTSDVEDCRSFNDLSFRAKSDRSKPDKFRSSFKVTHFPTDSLPSCLASVESLFARLKKHALECTSISSKRKDEASCFAKDLKEDFREIPVFPRLGDLSGDIQPNLRVNKAKGGYKGVDDYLDVQFQLLRQDFVEPLKDGIFCFKAKTFGREKKKENNIRVYRNVRIESFICEKGIHHVLSFDKTKLKHIRWNTTERLKYGSLVCLSADNFKTCFFATVVTLDVKSRREGRVHVKFAPDSKQINFLIGSTFTMIESIVYFEAYRPVLASLQAIRENDLPFQEYIIKCNQDVLPPKYLRRSEKDITFDLRSLFEPDVEIRSDMQNFEQNEKAVGRKNEFSSESKVMKRVDILHSNWPREDMLNLDPSQLSAIKTALTSEFSIIQGPLGCGKTYIGLEIAKVLLHNKYVWRHEDGTRAQMLVVCYTNHALDQFMAGICSFFKGSILRVGGRGSNKTLEQHNLKAIKSQLRKKHAFPLIYYKSRMFAQYEVKTLQWEINLEFEKIQSLRENIVHEESLYVETGSVYNQFLLLQQRRTATPLRPWLAYLDGSVIVEWLGILDLAKQIQKDIYLTNDVGIDRLLDEQNMTEERNTKSYVKVPTGFKTEHISLDFHDINNFDEHLFGERKRKIIKIERRALTEKVHLLLRETRPMSESEALLVGDILSERFSKEKRWALYLFWVQKKCSKMYSETETKIDEYQAADARLKEIFMMEERYIFRAADIIGMSVTGAALHKTNLTEIKPTIMIVEEAAEVFESDLISNLTSGCEQLILIGDHKQLKPKPNVYRLEKDFNFGMSLFERMVKNGIKCDCLQVQHRMRPEIADNVRHIYEILIDHDCVKRYESVSGISHDMFFIDHRVEEEKNEEHTSHTNEHETKYLIALCRYLLLQGYDASKITILTTYKRQMLMMKREKLKQGKILNDVRITVVDDYQGEENEIILLSLVRSNRERRVGFLDQDNRVCVALSRAKKGLYVIGNFEALAASSSLWKSIIIGMKQKGRMGKALPLYCQNHPKDKGLMAENSIDFNELQKEDA